MKNIVFVADCEKCKETPFFSVNCYRNLYIFFDADMLHYCSRYGFCVSGEDAYNIREQDGCISGQAKDRETQ